MEGMSESESSTKKKMRRVSYTYGSGGWEILLKLEENRKESEDKRLSFERDKFQESRQEGVFEREQRMERMRLEKE